MSKPGNYWYPRSQRMRNLFKGYAMENELKDTELLDKAVKHYFESLKLSPEYEQRLLNNGRHYYLNKKSRVIG